MNFSSVLVLDDHPMMAEAIMSTIRDSVPRASFTLAHSLNEARKRIEANAYDLVIADLHMADAAGLETVTALKDLLPRSVLAICSATTDKKLALDCLEHGANAFISKNDEPGEILHAMNQLKAGRVYFSASLLHKPLAASLQSLSGGAKSSIPIEPILAGKVHRLAANGATPLSERQAEVVSHLLQGMSNCAIAQALGVSEATVKIHVAAALKHFGVSNRVQLLVLLTK